MAALTRASVRALGEAEIRGLSREGLEELLTHWEEELSEAQSATVVSIIEEWAAAEDDEDDDEEGFVLDQPLTPKHVAPRRRRSSLNDSVWTKSVEKSPSCEVDERVCESVCSSMDQALPSDDSPTVTTESVRYAESEASEMTVNLMDEAHEGRVRAGEFYNAPKRFEPSVDNLDHECNAKRRAKAADDAAEFARALRWVAAVVGCDPPCDCDTRPEESFGEHLKDGCLLCQLLNKIQPGLVKKVTKHSALAFHQMSNITNFLRGCQTLGVHKRDCFDTVDLQQLKDLSKVYETLLMLSQTVEKTVPTFPGPYLYSAKREERRRRRSSTSSCASEVIKQLSPRRPAAIDEAEPSSETPTPPTPPPLTSNDLDDLARRPADERAAAPAEAPIAPVANADGFDSLDDLVDKVGLQKYAKALNDYVDDISDLAEMTHDDFQDFVDSNKMPALKARRFKKALVDLGAKLV